MKAVIVDKPGQFKVVERDIPRAESGKVVIKVAYASICGSDAIYWSGDLMLGHSLGHEFSGTIWDPGTSDFQKGDRVCAMELNPCGNCPACRSGRVNICPGLMKGAPGISTDGAYAEYVAVRQDMVRRLPEGVSLQAAAMAEPLAVSYHGVRRAGIRGGERLLVWGDGPIGAFTAACARAMGAAYIGLVGKNPHRMAQIQSLDIADETFDINDPEYLARIKSVEPERFSLILECTGRRNGISAALGILANGGKLITLGIHDDIQELNTLRLLLKEQEIIPSAFFTPADYDAVLALLASGEIKADAYATSVRPLEQAQAAFLELTGGGTKEMKILLDPTL